MLGVARGRRRSPWFGSDVVRVAEQRKKAGTRGVIEAWVRAKVPHDAGGWPMMSSFRAVERVRSKDGKWKGNRACETGLWRLPVIGLCGEPQGTVGWKELGAPHFLQSTAGLQRSGTNTLTGIACFAKQFIRHSSGSMSSCSSLPRFGTSVFILH